MALQDAVKAAIGNLEGYVAGFHGDKVSCYVGLTEAFSKADAATQEAMITNLLTKGGQRLAQEQVSSGDDLADAKSKVTADKIIGYRLGVRVGVAKLSPVDRECKAIVASLLASEEGRKIVATLLGRTVAVDKKGDQFKADVAELLAHAKVVAKAEKRVKDNLAL